MQINQNNTTNFNDFLKCLEIHFELRNTSYNIQILNNITIATDYFFVYDTPYIGPKLKIIFAT